MWVAYGHGIHPASLITHVMRDNDITLPVNKITANFQVMRLEIDTNVWFTGIGRNMKSGGGM